MDFKALKAGLDDELSKIAGELQGFTRIGRRPISAERLLERESESNRVPSDVAKTPMTKTSVSGMGAAALIGSGVLGYHMLRQAERDRRLGRSMRQQQSY